jgi:glycine/D-amino acid oxidase-like deaminating enzyme
MEELAVLDSPDFSFDPATRPYLAGVRPYRKVSYRLEADPNVIPGKLVVHNYGHGGAGITMSWGCAEIVRDIVTSHGTAGGVAVLGAGIMGLTVATVLREAGAAVKVFADKFTPRTTSDKAGGQWAPSLVEYVKTSPAARNAYFDVLRRARRGHERRGPAYGVFPRTNYAVVRLRHLDELPVDIVRPARALRLPFARLNRRGFSYELLLMEVPVLMAKLHADLGASTFVSSRFGSLSDISTLPQSVIVNCTGLGSKTLFNDAKMVPIKGQLVRLRPQLNLQYLLSGDGYVFPRSDGVIVGGTEDCVDDDNPVDAACIKLVDHMKRMFDGRRFLFARRPRSLIRGK